MSHARKRLIAIGDIHGHLILLDRLLKKISPEPADQLVFLGDYIDRGPDSRDVIERLIDFRRRFPATVFLRGNHEQMLLDALIDAGVISGKRLRDISPAYADNVHGSDADIFRGNGGRETLASYQIQHLEDGLPPDHLNFLLDTRLCWRHEFFLFVHAGAFPGLPAEEQDPYVLLWERYAPPGEKGEIHVVGHHPTMDGRPYFEPGRYSLDTGAAYGRTLTACDVRTKELWQVP